MPEESATLQAKSPDPLEHGVEKAPFGVQVFVKVQIDGPAMPLGRGEEDVEIPHRVLRRLPGCPDRVGLSTAASMFFSSHSIYPGWDAAS